MRTPHRKLRRLIIGVCAGALGLSLAACGQKSHPTFADNEGEYVWAGPITYQVQLSRELNPYSIEDRTYINGSTATPPNRNQLWFGVFMWAKNQTSSNEMTSSRFDIEDSAGRKYYPVPINSQINPFAWTAQTLQPNQTEPNPQALASYGPTQGGLLLFKLDDTIYSNRPLTLQIYAPGSQLKGPSEVSLDL